MNANPSEKCESSKMPSSTKVRCMDLSPFFSTSQINKLIASRNNHQRIEVMSQNGQLYIKQVNAKAFAKPHIFFWSGILKMILSSLWKRISRPHQKSYSRRFKFSF